MSAAEFDGTPMTKREVLIARDAADDAVKFVFEMARRLGGIEHVDGRTYAAECYPLPKVTRPRVVRDPEHGGGGSYYEWSVQHDRVHFRWSFAALDDWKEATGGIANMLLTPTPERIAVWAYLLANPTEECEVEDGES